jgi:tetratricopeptide (TPR) repeat protein
MLAVGMALGSAVLLVLSAITLVADARLKDAADANDVAAMDAVTRAAPWHAEAQYLAAYGQVTQALAMQTQGMPGAEQALDAAGGRVDALIEQNPYEYDSLALKAYFLMERGIAANSKNLVGRARTAAREALELYPLSPVAALTKAQCEAALGDLDAALETLEPLWNIDPVYTDAGILYVKLLAQTGQTEEARAAVVELKAKHPWDQKVLELEASLEASGTAQ